MKLNHISRETRVLVEQGYIVKKNVHVLGFRKRIGAYFLTNEGANKTEHIISAIKEIMVTTIDEFGNADTVKLETALKRMGGKFSLLELLRMRDIETGKVTIVSKTTIPKEQAEFVGRNDELDVLSDWIKNHDTNVLVLYGIAGIGKTSLVLKFMNTLENWTKLLIKIHEWDSIRGVLEVIADAFMSVGDEQLRSYLKNRAQINNTNLSFILHNTLSSHRFLLVLDDAWTASNEIWEFISLLFNSITGSETKIILISREFPSGMEGSFKARGVMTKIRLDGLKKEDARQLLLRRKLPGDSDKFAEEAIRLLQGHPLLMRMIQDVDDIKALYEGDIARFIHGEIYSRLDPQEIAVLNSLSVLRYPIQVKHLKKAIKYEIIESLHRKALIELSGDNVVLHDMIRSFVLSYLSDDERKECHRLIYGIMQSMEPYLIERIYHAISAGLVVDALHELASNREHLISLGHAQDILILLKEVPKMELPPSRSSIIPLVRMICLLCIGDYTSVIKIYEKRIRRDRLDNEMMSIAAEAYLEKGDLKMAYTIYRLLKKRRMNTILKLRVIRGLGKCYALTGKYHNAQGCYLKALTIAKRMGREDIIGQSLIDLGSIEVYRDQAKIGTKYFLEAMRYLRMNEHSLAAIYGNLSLCYCQQSMYEMALGMIEHAEGIYNQKRDYVGSLKCMINKGAILGVLERYNDSETILLRALNAARKTNMKPLVTSALTNLSYIYLATRRFDDAMILGKRCPSHCKESWRSPWNSPCEEQPCPFTYSTRKNQEGHFTFKRKP